MNRIGLTRRALLAGGSLALAGLGTAGRALAQPAAGKTIQFILPVAVASGAALTSCCVPMSPPAPGWLLTTTVPPSAFDNSG